MRREVDLSRRNERETFIKAQKGDGVKNDRQNT